MTRKNLLIIIFIVLLILSNLITLYYLFYNKKQTETTVKKSQLYVCPMHPQIQQDHPGTCPICNMELVLKDDSVQNNISQEKKPELMMGDVVLSPSQQVLANVKTEVAKLSDFTYVIEANGVVKLRDDAVRQVSAPVKGKITKLYINYEGQKVRKGQKVFELYSPELIATQKEFLLAYENYLKAEELNVPGIKENATAVLNAAKQRLQLWFVDEKEIEELIETRQIKSSLTYYTEFSGVVTKKYFNEGSWVMDGTTVLEVVNLYSVWIMANIYESEISQIKVGQKAEIVLAGDNTTTLFGKVDYITPFVNPGTRTIEVRFTISNSNLKLKPGMYVKVKLQTNKLFNVIVIPKTALLQLGKEDIVYVKKSSNVFAPRKVIIAVEKEGKVIVKSGLESGEEVVTSAGFLLDSESQIRMGNHNEMQNMEMPPKSNDYEIRENDAIKDMKQHRH
ncbi:MAG: efflux RND transporter periplasmic adaptor subunit [Ignavibacteria bacterium]